MATLYMISMLLGSLATVSSYVIDVPLASNSDPMRNAFQIPDLRSL